MQQSCDNVTVITSAGKTAAETQTHWIRRVLLIGAFFLVGISASISMGVARAEPAMARIQAAPATQESGVLAVASGRGARLLAEPGGELLQDLPAGAVLTAVGRTADSAWTAVVTDDNTSGWVASSDIVMFGGDQLPVMAGGEQLPSPGSESGGAANLPSPTPTTEPTATPTPTPMPTATPTPTPSPTPVLAAPTPNSGGQTASQVAVVRSGGTDLFTMPGGETVQPLPTGTALTVWGRTEGGVWLAAVTPSGKGGWVQTADVVAFNIEGLPVIAPQANMLAQPEAAEAEPTPTAVASSPEQASIEVTVEGPASQIELGITATVAVTNSRLNVRSGPSTDYRVIAKALPGELFSAIGRTADSSWVQITGGKLGGEDGWVAGEFVSLSAPTDDLPVTFSEESDVEAASGAGLAIAPAVPESPAPQLSAGVGLQGNLVFQTGLGKEIYTMNLASGEMQYLTSGIDPAISPDGKTVVFTRDGGGHGLYLINIDGSDERRIYAGGEGLRSPTWSPDGQFILFSRKTGEYKCRDVGFGICLPDNPFLSDFDLVKRPDYGLSRVNVDGAEFRDLPALTSAKAPSWGPGGIAYQSSTSLEITSDEAEGDTRLLLNAPYYQDPDWQPGGNRIIFQSREGSHWEIFIVNEDGTGLSALTRPVTTLVDELPSNVSPAWSWDGEHIVYLSNRDDKNSAGDWRLWVMNADGSAQRPLPIDLPFEYTFSAEQMVDWGKSPEQ